MTPSRRPWPAPRTWIELQEKMNKGTHDCRRRSLNRVLPLRYLPDDFSPYYFTEEADESENESEICKSDVLHDSASVAL